MVTTEDEKHRCGVEYPPEAKQREEWHTSSDGKAPTRHEGTGVEFLYLEDASGAYAEPQPQAEAQQGEAQHLPETTQTPHQNPNWGPPLLVLLRTGGFQAGEGGGTKLT